jgi:hypothetical protein
VTEITISTPNGAHRLSGAAVEDFRRDGFVLARGFFAQQDMQHIERWCDALVARAEKPGAHWVYYEDDRRRAGGRVLSRIENFCPFHAEFASLLQTPWVMDSVQCLFGEPAVLFKDKINFKVPGSDGFEPHQDVQAGWDRYADLHITMLVSVDAATAHNGCLEIAPGWHNRGLLGEQWKPLGDRVPAREYVACPTQPGDVVFFDSFAPHRSAANLTDEPRRVLYLTYNALSAGDQRERYYQDKHASFPPDIERIEGHQYSYRV